MANPEHVEIVKQGANAIRDWQGRNTAIKLDLRDANLSQANLSCSATIILSGGKNNCRSTLSNADLSKANLVGAILREANLSEANLRHANLSYANLNEANLREAKLRSADLRFAELVGADLRNTDLSGAVFQRCTFENTNFYGTFVGLTAFSDVDFSKAVNLGSALHVGPSTIGADTLMRSQGRIPEEFLRGCGLTDDFIAYIPSVFGTRSPIQFYSCFISYSHRDEEFCKRLHSKMRDEKLRVWYAPEDMPGGKKLHDEIDQAIRLHDKLLLVLSDESMQSEWVQQEIYKARCREHREGKRVLFPIRLVPFKSIEEWTLPPDERGKDMAREIREYYIPDFSNWKDHDAFEAAFKRLLNDLKNADNPQQKP